MKGKKKVPAFVKRNRYFLVVIVIFLLIIAPGLFGGGGASVFFWNLFLSVGIIVSSLATYEDGGGKGSTRRVTVLVLGGMVFVINWMGQYLSDSEYSVAVIFLCNVGFLFMIILNSVRFILKSKQVSSNTLFAAMAVYLMLGLIGGFLFVILEGLSEAPAFKGVEQLDMENALYLSFVTLTTLGYGDITPVSHFAKKLTILLSVVGQFYVAVLMAVLVGKYTSGK
ncbi:hypothetical protein FUAX_16410 [Fulvitalea axinellae]|uniref:Potassium channel domain-containing protein n=1 Tax=Fulvitalea axinellae TaxID=1182444 RepID=A0AAU9CAV1_9BACT|nr:hypothetical protein FUAX_16410 [Fulvitalea axinellae]